MENLAQTGDENVKPGIKIANLLLLWGWLLSSAYGMDSDKTKHAVAGTLIYGACVGIGSATDTEWLNYKTCLLPVFVAAAGKEAYDAATDGDAEWADAGATVAFPLMIAGVTFLVYEW
ncbi:hypothetical protein [Hydrogenimonas urashimensis]|uniref:hypothetical protein n=1 Tax=Hydrogenimonas urashimensis TaxID=2740515 RepID=UPI0019152CBD|nr:hypothetical protein [Hydrogenimonas urashimensis]